MISEDLHRLDALLVRRWRHEAGLSRPRAAGELGISARMLAYYEGGVHAVPKTVMLAVRMLAAEAGIELPGSGMGRDRWVVAVAHALAYGSGEAVVGRLAKEGRHSELRDLLQLLRAGPPSDMALTDPALFRMLREAGTKAWLSGLGTLRAPVPHERAEPENASIGSRRVRHGKKRWSETHPTS